MIFDIDIRMAHISSILIWQICAVVMSCGINTVPVRDREFGSLSWQANLSLFALSIVDSTL